MLYLSMVKIENKKGDKMKIKEVERVAKRVSKKYGVENCYVVTRINRNKILIRTELPSYEGGYELSRKLEKLEQGWICENDGGCVYTLYKPL